MIINIETARKNYKLIANIHNNNLLFVDIGNNLIMKIKKLQKGMPNAVTASDIDKLEATSGLVSQLGCLVTSAFNNLNWARDQDLIAISNHINEYFQIAFSISVKMNAGDLSDESTSNIQEMINLHQ